MSKFSRAAFEAKQLEAAKNAKTYQVKLPSGFDFELRYPPIRQWIAGDRLPSALVAAMIELGASTKTPSPEQLAEFEQKISVADHIKFMVFQRDAVQFACVSPKLVDKPENELADDEIAPWELPSDDFNFIFTWAMEQAKAASSDAGK